MTAPIRLALGLFLFVSALAVGAVAAWDEQDHRYASKISELKRAYDADMRAISDKAAEAVTDALLRQQDLEKQIAALDERHTKEIYDARIENDRLAAAVDAGAVQLRIRAACPTGGGAVSGAAGAARLDDAGSAVLDAAARQSYFALRRNLTDTEGKLSALQDYVRTILAKPAPATLPVPQRQE